MARGPGDSGVRSTVMPDTPIGHLGIWATRYGVRRIGFAVEDLAGPDGDGEVQPKHLNDAVRQLQEYFGGSRATFDVELDFSGATEFQRRIYRRLLQIPHGRIVSYGDIADELGEPGAARAVGQAVGANPLPIVVPCHRVVRSDGRLGGYAGGLVRKVTLLRLEGIDVEGPRAASKVHPEVLRLPL